MNKYINNERNYKLKAIKIFEKEYKYNVKYKFRRKLTFLIKLSSLTSL